MAVRIAAAFIVLGLATAAGVASFQGPTQRPSIAVPPPAQVVPADPRVANPSAFLDALNQENIPLVDTSTMLLIAGSVCARQSDTTVPAEMERLMTAFPGQWDPQQAAIIVYSAITLACGETAPPGPDVRANVQPAE